MQTSLNWARQAAELAIQKMYICTNTFLQNTFLAMIYFCWVFLHNLHVSCQAMQRFSWLTNDHTHVGSCQKHRIRKLLFSYPHANIHVQKFCLKILQYLFYYTYYEFISAKLSLIWLWLYINLDVTEWNLVNLKSQFISTWCIFYEHDLWRSLA